MKKERVDRYEAGRIIKSEGNAFDFSTDGEAYRGWLCVDDLDPIRRENLARITQNRFKKGQLNANKYN